MDKRTIENVASLNPKVESMAIKLLNAIEAPLAAVGIKASVISGLRSWATQQKLYAQGRTAPGRIVTKAPPGSSWHNYGLAIDFGLFDDKTSVYLDEKDPRRADKAYAIVAKIAVAQGWEWAGNWKSFKETPHFQYTGGIASIKAAKERFMSVGMNVDKMIV